MTTIDNSNGLGARMIDMKSIQPYGTRDEYLYAMKEDLAEWFNSMYFTETSSGGIEAETFVEQLENGVIICSHANAVMRSAIAREHRFDSVDLQNAGILGSTKANVLATPNGKGANWAGEFILYRADARPQSFQARDNIANFIRWCRFICKVREVLMFETEDLILRKNEKNFILCLLEVARFGSKFGVQVPTIVRMEQEIQAEIEAEMEREKSAAAALLTAAIEPEETATIVLKKEIEEEEEMLVLYLENNKKSASNTTTTKGSVLVEERELNSNGSYDEATNSSVSEEDEPSTSSSSSNAVAIATDQTNNVDKFVVVASCTVSSSCDDDDDDVAEAEIVGKVEKSKSFSDSLENLTNYNTLNMEMNNTSEQQTATLRNETNQSPSTRTLEALALDGDYESGANSSSTDDTETRDDSSSTSSKSHPQILDSEIINSLSSAALQQAPRAEIIVVETITTAIAPTQETQPNPSSLVPSPLSTSISSSSSCHAPIAQLEEPLPPKEQVVVVDKPLVKQEDIVKVTLPPPKPPTQKAAARNLNDLFKSSANSDHSKIKASSDIQRIEAYLNETSENQRLKSGGGNRSRSASRDRSVGVANSVSGTSVKAGGHHHHQSQTNLHVHVCSIADRCTCEMQFPVVKIGEGKYRIGNTKNIVFIRILRNHIMVRVGGGWDTLENYLNKHDPCRCVSSNNNNESTASHFSGARQRSTHTDHNSESTNILLTPVSTNQASSNQSDPERTPLQPRPSATLVTPSCSLHQYNNTHLKPSVDFTDAKLLIERNTDGKHVVGKILLNKTTATSTNNEIPRSSSNINLATPNTTSSSVVVVSSQQKQVSNIVSGSSYAPLSLANFNLNNNNNSDAGEMNSLMRNANNFFFSSSSSSAHSSSSSTSSASSTSTKPSGDAAAKKQPIANSTSLNAIQHLQSGSGPTTTSLSSPGTLRVKMKKLINKLPIQHNEHHNESEDNRSQNSGNTPSHGSGGIFRNSSKSSSSSSNRNGGGTLFRLRHEDAANSSGGASPRKTSADTKASDFLSDLVSINKIEPSNVYTDTILPARIHRPIYTETNLPPRLLRKYEKRANTDANLLNANNMLLTSVQSVLSDKQQQNSDSVDVDSNDKPTIIDSPKEQTEESKVTLDYVKSESPDPIKLFESGRIEGQEEEKREEIESVNIDRNQEAAEEEEEEEEPISGLAKKGAFEPRPPPRANRYKKYAKYNKSNTADLSRHIIVEQDSLSSPPSQKAILLRRHSNKENEEEDADSLEGVEAVTSTSISNSKIEATTTTSSNENSEKNTSELTKTSSISSSDENKIKDEDEEDDEENRTEFNDSLESLNQKSKNPTSNEGVTKKRTSIGSEHSADILDTAEIDKLLMSMDTRLKAPVSQSDENSLSLLLMPAANRVVDTNPSITTTTTTTTTTATTVIARQSRWRSSSSSSSISTSDEAKSGSVVPVVYSVSAHDATAASTASRRAQWDKSAQEFDYKSQFLMNSVQPPPRKPSTNTTTTTTPSKSRAQSSAPPSKVVVAHVKTNLNTETSTPQPTQTTKKARNLKLAKEQLYEMKRTIDARVIPNHLNSTEYSSSSSSITTSSSVSNRQQPPTMVNSPFNSKQTMRQPIAVAATASVGVRATPATTNGERTTPRKVKKRSGERSLTTGIIFDQSNALMSVDDDSEVANATSNLNQSRTNLSKTPLKSSSSQLAAWSSAARPTQSSLLKARQASSSLHNLATAHNHPDHARSMTPTAQRLRRDSAASTASSATCLSAAGASLCYPSADYKENKASELRKKSALMNKIILKSQLVNDPIFARANPIHQEIALVEQQQFMNDETLNFINANAINNDSTIASSSASSSSARKRLFVKKGERAFDPNASSASSTTSSSTASAFHPTIGREKRTVPTSMNFMNGLESPISSSPMQMKTSSPLGRTKSPSSPLKREQSSSSSSSSSPSSKTLPSWARSSNDLVLLSQQQRTNSQRDLLELMNNCVSPRGDAEAYRRMTEECEEMRAKISSSTTPTPSGRKPRKMASRTTTERIIVDEPPLETPADLNNSINSSSSSSMSPKTRRSTSMPSYEQPANDTTLDEFMSGFVNLNCPEQAALLK